MLKKLLKHEFYATGKTLIPIYAITLIIALVNRVTSNIQSFRGPLKILQVLVMFAYGISIIATLFVTFVFIILRFYKNLMTDEGYLMFTLPVKPAQLINSKLIVSIIWTIVSTVITVCAFLILFISPERMSTIREAWNSIIVTLRSAFGDKFVLFTTELILIMFISLIQQILLIYVSIAAGSLFSGHRILGAFASYIAINTVMQIITTVLMFVWMRLMSSSIEELDAVPQLIFPFVLVTSIVLAVIYYLGTYYIFSRKLNLE